MHRVRLWLKCITAEGRRRVRATDVDVVWPQLWRACAGNLPVFFQLAATHMTRSPAWKYDWEWVHTASNPGRWLGEFLPMVAACKALNAEADR